MPVIRERIGAYCSEHGLQWEVLSYHSFGQSMKQALEAAEGFVYRNNP